MIDGGCVALSYYSSEIIVVCRSNYANTAKISIERVEGINWIYLEATISATISINTHSP